MKGSTAAPQTLNFYAFRLRLMVFVWPLAFILFSYTHGKCAMMLPEFMTCMDTVGQCDEWATTRWCECFHYDLCNGWRPEETCNMREGKVALLKEECSARFSDCLGTGNAATNYVDTCVCDMLACLSYGINHKSKRQVKEPSQSSEL